MIWKNDQLKNVLQKILNWEWWEGGLKEREFCSKLLSADNKNEDIFLSTNKKKHFYMIELTHSYWLGLRGDEKLKKDLRLNFFLGILKLSIPIKMPFWVVSCERLIDNIFISTAFCTCSFPSANKVLPWSLRRSRSRGLACCACWASFWRLQKFLLPSCRWCSPPGRRQSASSACRGPQGRWRTRPACDTWWIRCWRKWPEPKI